MESKYKFNKLDNALKSIARFKHLAPDVFLTSGKIIDLIEIRRVDSEELLDVDELRDEAERAKFGKGSKTVLDENVRKAAVLGADHVRVHWPQLASVLLNVQRELLWWLPKSHLYLDAKFYQIIYYENGSKFKVHRDSRRAFGGEYAATDHVLTLVADVTPPYANEDQCAEVIFHRDRRVANFKKKPWVGHDRRPHCTREWWRSHNVNRREWGAWHTSVYHEVDQFNEDQRRVVVAFDVYLRKQPLEMADDADRVDLCLNGLDAFVWQRIALHMGVDVCNLRRCSRYFRHHIDNVHILASAIRSPLATVREHGAQSGHTYLSALLYHTYSVAAGTAVTVDKTSLYGCDRLFVDALRLLGFDMRVTRTVASRERHQDDNFIDYDVDSTEAVHIGRQLLNNSEASEYLDELYYSRRWPERGQVLPDVPTRSDLPAELSELFRFDSLSFDFLLSCRVRLDKEYDGNLEFVMRRWRGVLLAESAKTLDARTDFLAFDSVDDLWGNGAVFDLLCYTKTMLHVDLGTGRCKCACTCLLEDVRCICECGEHELVPPTREP